MISGATEIEHTRDSENIHGRANSKGTKQPPSKEQWQTVEGRDSSVIFESEELVMHID